MSNLELTFNNIHNPNAGPEVWPDTMWPLKLSVLRGLPDQLWPDTDELREMVHPWQLLTALNRIREERITETRGLENVDFKNRSLTDVEGPVWFAPGVRVRPFSSIQGPTYIGGEVGSYALVRDSLLAGAAGAYCEIVRSYLAPGSVTSHRNGVLDSIVGPDAHLGGRARATNALPGGRNVRVTVNGEKIDTGLDHFGTIIGEGADLSSGATTMPGKFVGEFCVVGAGVIVYTHVPDNCEITNPPVDLVVRQLERP